jgi:UDP-N-acetylglucosamine/UDP-N-acetylgalactosamine 4-epimerase
MPEHYARLQQRLKEEPHRWLVTGVAGFIGSALLEKLLQLNQQVVGLDNFITGKRANLADVQHRVSKEQWERFKFSEGDIRSLGDCRAACEGAEIVLHQAALGSVPRSIEDPLLTHDCNLNGFINMLVAARDAGVRRFVYAASSSTYGDSLTLPKREDVIGRPLSPYAVTKYVNELYADVFTRCYGLSAIGLRYFNVFGRRQDPEGAYAAVIPLWFASMLQGKPIYINGDGETSRDFCHVDNAVQANLLAGSAKETTASSVYNVAVGERTTLNQLFELIRDQVASHNRSVRDAQPVYREFRPGDVRHSLADISLARDQLDYAPAVDVRAGLREAAAWYLGASN